MFKCISQAVSIILLFFIIFPGGTYFCRMVVKKFKLTGPTKDTPPEDTANDLANAGKIIGYFERFIIVAGILVRSWELIAIVAALKTVARYQELDKKISAEYFLIGSLASLSWALFWGEILRHILVWLYGQLGQA